MYETALYRAIQYFGSQQALAEVIGVSQPAINHWLNRAKRIPYVQAVKIAVFSQGHISISELTSEQKELTFLLEQSTFLKNIPVICLPIDRINVSHKVCPIYKDIKDIVPHIRGADFARPILIDSHNQLITCECRLRAHQQLGHKKVKVSRIDLNNTVRGKISLHALIHDFPISERVDIGLSIEQALGNRQGKRTDLKLPQDNAEVIVGCETRKLTAEIVGLGSHYSYGQAKEVFHKGLPELAKAMDDKQITISKARQVANLSMEEQLLFLQNINQQKLKKQEQTSAKNPYS